jgi:hypothetical protein
MNRCRGPTIKIPGGTAPCHEFGSNDFLCMELRSQNMQFVFCHADTAGL